MEIPLLQEVVIILGLSVLVILVFQQLKLPTILGFLLTGIVAGPNGLSFIQASHEVEVLSEIGVILLLFVIGIEFSLRSLAAIRNTVLIGGAFQVVGTIVVTLVAMKVLGATWAEGVFIGFLFSLSSTAIVLKLLQDKGEMTAPHGRIVLAILIFQDIIVVPMMLFTPLLAGTSDDPLGTLGLLLLKTTLVIGLVIVSARYIFPRLLFAVAKSQSRELFVLTIVVTCFSVAWLTSTAGLSLALGAFMAGLIISESEYSYQATSNILPFREIFTSFFFVSIGMLLDVRFLASNLPTILGLTVLAMVGKGLVATGAGAVLRYPPRTSLMVGLALFQVGEFAFILSRTGIETGLLSEAVYQYFLAISILTMIATPFVLMFAEPILKLFLRSGLSQRIHALQNVATATDDFTEELKDHLVIIGYGINGRNVARAARYADIPHVILDMNAETVRAEKAHGQPILFGDAAEPFILDHVKIYRARVAVIAISDPVAARNIVTAIRTICRTVYIIVRTRFIREIEEAQRLGADEVIPEEFETSIEIFTRVLSRYLVPMDELETFVQRIRSDNYQMLRPMDQRGRNPLNLHIPNIRITCLNVQQEDNDVIGKTVGESNIRREYGINVLAIQRAEQFITDIHSDTRIESNDQLYVLGSPESISEFNRKMKV